MDFSEALQVLREAVRRAQHRYAHHASGLLRIEARHALAAEAAAGRADRMQASGSMISWHMVCALPRACSCYSFACAKLHVCSCRHAVR